VVGLMSAVFGFGLPVKSVRLPTFTNVARSTQSEIWVTPRSPANPESDFCGPGQANCHIISFELESIDRYRKAGTTGTEKGDPGKVARSTNVVGQPRGPDVNC
jgi:hypothetical protein